MSVSFCGRDVHKQGFDELKVIGTKGGFDSHFLVHALKIMLRGLVVLPRLKEPLCPLSLYWQTFVRQMLACEFECFIKSM
eukprot:XP_001706764.1 Hypothetical protein GL50803_92342 [Giardia lamblia ATCC 50803]